ncbi:MAG: hypothetical protein KDK65_01580, partial [Chlamydiia bacterium]|nr:hypothetical protein [Chlamydiia bacterium]
MKKWIAALLIGGFILLMGYRQPIREFAGSHLLQWYCAHMLGVKVKTKTFEWGERKFVLQGVTASAEGLGSLEVETVTVRYEPHWLLRQIHIDAKVEQPKIAGKLGSSAEEPFFAIFPFRKLTGTIHFKQGECILAEGQPPLEFNGFCRFDKRIHSYLTINEKEKLPQATFNLKQGKHQRYHVQLSLDQFPARVLSPYLEKGFVEEGILSGNLDIDYSPNSTPNALGDVICDGLKVRKDHLTAQFGKIHLNLNEEESKISVAKHAKISFKDLQGHSHEINQVGGHFEVQEDGDFTFNLSGFCRHDEEKKTLVVTGGQKDQLFQLDLHFVTRQQEDSQLSLSIKKGEREDLLEMAFNHFDRQSFQTTQHLLMPLFPSLDHVIFHHGHLTANLKGILRNGVIDELSFNHFSFRNGKVHFPYWQFSCGADSLIGKGSIQFSHPHPIETLFSEADVKNGYLHFDSISNLGTLKQIQSQIRVEKGVIQNSKASVSWAGLKGEMELKGLSPQEIVKVSLKGNSSDLAPFLPEKWGKKIEGEELSVVAKFGRANRGFVTKGEISLDSPLTHDKETLLFALEFEKNKQHPFTQSPELGASWDSMIPHFLHMVAPHFTYPQGHLHSPSQTEYLSFGQFQFKQGWIKSDEIAFEKYFGVFLPSSLQLTGTGPIHAIFDANEFFLRYHSNNLRFENDHFLLNIVQMQTQATLPAFHYINFNSTSSFSFIPVKQALFLDKGTQLSFEDLRGDIIYDGDQLHVPKCTGYCKGMEFSSQIAIEHKEDIDVNFKFHTLDGSFTELRKILEHLAIPDFLSQIPLEGKFALRDPGLLFQINQQGTNITGSALIENGEIVIEPNTLNIKDLSLNIEYDQERSSLVFDEINGSVLLGSGNKVEEYQLGGLGISFDHIIEKRATFDLVVKDHNAEMIRINGAAFPGDAEGGIEIFLNPSQTHFGLIYPEEINFLLKDWHTVEAFDAKLSFHLNDVLQTFQRFQQADISLFHVLEKFENMGGECFLETHYDWEKGRIDFAATGEDILINQRHFNTFQAHGYYKNQTYFLEQFQLDPLHLSAEFCKQHDHLIANFIGFRYGDSLLMGLEGELDLNTYATTANIKMFEMDLSRSAELLSLPKNLSGFLSGQGEYCDDVLQLNLSHRNLKWGKIGVQDHEDVTVIIDPEVTVKNFSGTFFNLENPSQTITIHSESLALPSSKQPLAVDQLNFSVSPE